MKTLLLGLVGMTAVACSGSPDATQIVQNYDDKPVALYDVGFKVSPLQCDDGCGPDDLNCGGKLGWFKVTAGAMTAYDVHTHLKWTRFDVAMTFDKALTFCNNLTVEDEIGWRLPRTSEMTTLDTKEYMCSSRMNRAALALITPDHHWTATHEPQFHTQERFNPHIGLMSPVADSVVNTTVAYVMCVK